MSVTDEVLELLDSGLSDKLKLRLVRVLLENSSDLTTPADDAFNQTMAILRDLRDNFKRWENNHQQVNNLTTAAIWNSAAATVLVEINKLKASQLD